MNQKTKDDLEAKLSPEAFHVTQEKGTEAPFSGEYYDFHKKGMYKCACCGNELFSSETKYESGTGWPSYYAPATSESVEMEEDRKLFMKRTEVHCKECKAHLGHIFDDGPNPTGKRYCINSVALKFSNE